MHVILSEGDNFFALRGLQGISLEEAETIEQMVRITMGGTFPRGGVDVRLEGCEPDPFDIAEAIEEAQKLGAQTTMFNEGKEDT